VTNGGAPTDAELAHRAQKGDKLSFEELVHRHKGPLFRFVRRSIGSDDDAYDIVQDSFVSAWMALHRFDQRKAFVTWLRAIALNKCRDHGRRQSVRRRFLRFLSPRDDDVPSENVTSLEREQETREVARLAALDRAIAELPTFYKEPLLLTTVGGLSQQEAALQLKTSTKAVEMRIRRAKKKLTETLEARKRDE
jgi:RNA polymerase sigma factor (sigma-70 family)